MRQALHLIIWNVYKYSSFYLLCLYEKKSLTRIPGKMDVCIPQPSTSIMCLITWKFPGYPCYNYRETHIKVNNVQGHPTAYKILANVIQVQAFQHQNDLLPSHFLFIEETEVILYLVIFYYILCIITHLLVFLLPSIED